MFGSHCVKVPERLLAEQEVMGSITATSKCFFPLWLEVETEASIKHEKNSFSQLWQDSEKNSQETRPHQQRNQF